MILNSSTLTLYYMHMVTNVQKVFAFSHFCCLILPLTPERLSKAFVYEADMRICRIVGKLVVL